VHWHSRPRSRALAFPCPPGRASQHAILTPAPSAPARTPAGLRRNADDEENVTRETVKLLLRRFTVYIDRDDEETFVDVFDPSSE